MSESLGNKATVGAVWATIDRFGSMTLQFIVNLIMARLLVPADFGAIGMLAIFIAVSQTLIDGGFSSALIQKKEPSQTDYSTIFFWNIFFSACLYLILFISAPLIAGFFNMPVLSSVLRVIGLNLILTAVIAIQTTRLRKSLAFRSIAITNISAYILGGACAVTYAYNGGGIWSLVMMQILYGLFSILILWIITRWHPSAVFSRHTMKELFGFGGYIMAANLLQTICQNIQGVIIGHRFSATQTGYYSQAYKLDQITSYSIPQVIVQVMYPVYSSIQDERKRLCDMLLMNIRVISYIIFPMLALLILVAHDLIEFLYGEQWLPSVPYFRILCVGGIFVCLQNINFYAVAAVGKSKSLFMWSFYKWGFLLLAVIIGAQFGMDGIMWGMVLSSANIYVVNAAIVQRYIHLDIKKQIQTILPTGLITILSFICSFVIKDLVSTNDFLIPAMCFFCLYILLSSRLKASTETYQLIRRLNYKK